MSMSVVAMTCYRVSDDGRAHRVLVPPGVPRLHALSNQNALRAPRVPPSTAAGGQECADTAVNDNCGHPKVPTARRLLREARLSAQAEPLDQGTVALDVDLLEVPQQTTTLPDQQQQTTT